MSDSPYDLKPLQNLPNHRFKLVLTPKTRFQKVVHNYFNTAMF